MSTVIAESEKEKLAVEARLGQATKHILAIAHLLAESQSLPSRYEGGETQVAITVSRLIDTYHEKNYRVSVATVVGEGIHTLHSKQGEPKPLEGNSVTGTFYFGGFRRGDGLGFPALGTNWYLMFGDREQEYLAPVDSIKTLYLQAVENRS